MAKRSKKKNKVLDKGVPENIKDESLDNIITEMMLTYSTYVLEGRVIPAFQDGLKPVQRRLLWTLYKELNSRPEKNTIKSAQVTGITMGRFHPHAGSYDSLVNLIEGTPCPLVIGQGNFGNYSKNTPAANERYTEVKMSEFAMACFFDKRFEGSVQTIPNYDNTNQEPVVLTCQLPLILALGLQGIAVATTTKIPSFTIQSIYDITQKALKRKDQLVTAEQCLKTLDFSSAYGGNMVSSEEEILELFKTGKGKVDWECEWHASEKDKCVHITGFPPEWNVDNKMSAISKIPEVAQVADMSDEHGYDIRVSFRRLNEDDWQDAVEKVSKHLSNSLTYVSNVVDRKLKKEELVDTAQSDFNGWNIPKILQHWVHWRMKLERYALKDENSKIVARVKHLNLLLLAANNLKIIFDILKIKKIDKVETLAKKLNISEEDSRAIWAIQVGKLDSLSKSDMKKEKSRLIKRSKEIKKLYKIPATAVSEHLKLNKKSLTGVK